MDLNPNDPLNGRKQYETLPLLTLASWIDRCLTWGIEPEERDDLLSERRSDRVDHLGDPDASMAAVAVRSMRSAVADLWYRFFDADASMLPVAVVYTLIGIGALSDAVTSEFGPVFRTLDIAAGVGFLALAAAGFLRPRELRRAWLLPGLVLASVGTLGGAVAMPMGAGSEMFDWINKAGLGVVAVGFAVVAVALIPRRTSRAWVMRGGAFVWGAALLVAIGQIGWALIADPVYSTRASSLMVAVACIVGAALMGRIRHLPIVT